MTDFREKYSRLCRDNRVEPLPTILEQARESCDNGGALLRNQLDLSTLCLSVGQCVVLAKCLRTDDTFTHLKLTDCILNDEGCKALCRGLKSNTSIRDIDLKGNSLRVGGAEAIGNLLKHNTTITRLSLEWNSVGALDEGVTYLAEGLAVNKSLESLDIRSNQISHKGAGELASALKKKNTLKELDLRWNNCGLLGGRALLSSLQHNKSLISLDLTGNDVPSDILQSIAVALGRNVEQQALKSQHQFRTTALTQEIKQLQEDSRIQISDLIGKLDHQRERFERTSRSSQLKMNRMQETLTETSHEKELLEAKCSMSEACASVAEQKVKDLGDLVVRLKGEADENRKKHKAELERGSQRYLLLERQHSEHVEASQKQQAEMETQIHELQVQQKRLEQHISSLTSELKMAHETMKQKEKAAEEKLQQEEERHLKIVREMERRHRDEETRLRDLQHSGEQTWSERFQQAENARFRTEELMSRLKSEHTESKRKWDDELAQTHEQLKEAHRLQVRELEEKVSAVQSQKLKLQSQLSSQASQLVELQSVVNSRDLEIQTVKRNLDESKKEAEHRCAGIQTEVSRLQHTLDQREDQLDNARAQETKLNERIARLESEMTAAAAQNKSKLSTKDTEITSLKEKLRQQALLIEHIQEEETRRAEQLQSAIQRYMKSSSQSVMNSVFQS